MTATRSAPVGSVSFRMQALSAQIGSLILIERPNPGLRADQSVDALAKAPQAAFLAAPRASAAVGAERSGHRRRYLPC